MESNTAEPETLHIKLTVTNDLTHKTTTYQTSVRKGGLLFEALNNLKDSDKGFRFEHTIDKNYGLYLESVNGVPGSKENRTYWQLLTETAEGSKPLDTGIGCYQVQEDKHIILKFTKWGTDPCPEVAPKYENRYCTIM